MKTKFIIGILGILLIGFAIADIIIVANKNKNISTNDISVTERSYLATKGVDEWNYTDSITNDEAIRDLISSSDYNLGEIKIDTYWLNCTEIIEVDCITYERVNYTTQEINDMLDELMIEKMKNLANVINERNNRDTPVIIREGDVNIGR